MLNIRTTGMLATWSRVTVSIRCFRKYDVGRMTQSIGRVKGKYDSEFSLPKPCDKLEHTDTSCNSNTGKTETGRSLHLEVSTHNLKDMTSTRKNYKNYLKI